MLDVPREMLQQAITALGFHVRHRGATPRVRQATRLVMEALELLRQEARALERPRLEIH